MIDRVLTEAVRADILGSGMDLVGFAPATRWEHAPELLRPTAILPEARTVVVCGIHITDTWTEMGGEPEPQDASPGGWLDQNSLLDRVAYRTARLLHNAGRRAIAVASSNIWRYRSTPGLDAVFAPDLSHIYAAVAAGLGELGWHGLTITPEFGARCRFISIVTDAVLTPSPLYKGPPLCDLCMACVKACPTLSMSQDLGPTRELRIEDRVYRFSGKNLWRCAWAEHFNLDLRSERVRDPQTVDETSILDEMAQHGTRRHARGVCQKVCVPPHLRSDEPSFGRADKPITQRRINRRYPENMPTLRKVRDDITAAAVRRGAELSAAAPMEPDSDAGRRVMREAPGLHTLLAFAMHVPGEALDSREFPSDTLYPVGWACNRRMHHLLMLGAV